MKPTAKPVQEYTVRVQGGAPQIIAGETFFAARAAFILEWMRLAAVDLDPSDVRAVPPGDPGKGRE